MPNPASARSPTQSPARAALMAWTVAAPTPFAPVPAPVVADAAVGASASSGAKRLSKSLPVSATNFLEQKRTSAALRKSAIIEFESDRSHHSRRSSVAVSAHSGRPDLSDSDDDSDNDEIQFSLSNASEKPSSKRASKTKFDDYLTDYDMKNPKRSSKRYSTVPAPPDTHFLISSGGFHEQISRDVEKQKLESGTKRRRRFLLAAILVLILGVVAVVVWAVKKRAADFSGIPGTNSNLAAATISTFDESSSPTTAPAAASSVAIIVEAVTGTSIITSSSSPTTLASSASSTLDQIALTTTFQQIVTTTSFQEIVHTSLETFATSTTTTTTTTTSTTAAEVVPTTSTTTTTTSTTTTTTIVPETTAAAVVASGSSTYSIKFTYFGNGESTSASTFMCGNNGYASEMPAASDIIAISQTLGLQLFSSYMTASQIADFENVAAPMCLSQVVITVNGVSSTKTVYDVCDDTNGCAKNDIDFWDPANARGYCGGLDACTQSVELAGIWHG
ncbi:hypothetical protein HDU83_000148 [Entophlyctis luteolus]|nr:hypothetical protein HDU83_000148 [Entophlyctis luteolus]